MRIVQEGDTCQIICPSCGLWQATYRLRDIDFSDNSGTVKNVLTAVCQACDQVVGIPSQSTDKVKAEYNETVRHFSE